jgi:hypothetical protein
MPISIEIDNERVKPLGSQPQKFCLVTQAKRGMRERFFEPLVPKNVAFTGTGTQCLV